ncbi:TRAP transporter substrate-binding protein [Alphaproteobacteria bacterium KMM 3653]|uniref:TRAP transporter substrate-binding protein n=1 Tax=Harenicola maris TaxID=2841044 RepID=A0AAP2G7W2_9RHOB|nr:TRAP transporter substrate-binding protein [Harenicola maris]
MNRFTSFAGAMGLAFAASGAFAQDVTLRVHHFLPERASLHAQLLVPLAERLDEASEGRIKLELFPAMSLGGRPGDLYDQAVDGAVDIVLTLPGYTAGRFNQTEVFELPFMMRDARATASAFWDLIESELQDGEYDETQILGGWVHGPGVIHSSKPVEKLEDLAGMELRGPTRVITDLLGEFGATPVGMPLPSIPENLSKGVIQGAVVPWEVVPSIKLQELVSNHTEVTGDEALYTATFVLAMNLDAYDDMPDELRDILDAETGKAFSADAGAAMAEWDAPSREISSGNNIIQLSAEEVARWKAAAQPVYDRWIARAEGEGFDGAAAIETARGLIESNM